MTTYTLDHMNGTLMLTVSEQSLTIRTRGKGLADKQRMVEIPLQSVVYFCLVPVIQAQHMVGGPGTLALRDDSYDSEFIVSYKLPGGTVKKRRLFVAGSDAAFQAVLTALAQARPDTSLLGLPPEDAQKQMGVMPAKTSLKLILLLMVGVPLLIVLVALLVRWLG